MAPLPRTPLPQDAEFLGSSHREASKDRKLKDAMIRRQQLHRERHYSDSIVEDSDEKEDDDDEDVGSETDDSTVDTQEVSRALKTIDRHANRRGLSRKQMIHILKMAGKEATEATSVDTTVADYSTGGEEEETRDALEEGTLDGDYTIEEGDEDDEGEDEDEHTVEQDFEDESRCRPRARYDRWRQASDSDTDEHSMDFWHRRRGGREADYEERDLEMKETDFEEEEAAQSWARLSGAAQDSILDMVESWVNMVTISESPRRGSNTRQRNSRGLREYDESSVVDDGQFTVDGSERSERRSVAKASVSIVDQVDTDETTSDPEDDDDEDKDGEEGEEVMLELTGERETYSQDDEYTYMTDDDDTIEEVFAAAMCSPRMRSTLIPGGGNFSFDQEQVEDEDYDYEEWTDAGTREYDEDEDYTLGTVDEEDQELGGMLSRNDQIRKKLGIAAAVLERVSKGIPMLRRRTTTVSDDEESNEESDYEPEEDKEEEDRDRDGEDVSSSRHGTRVWVAPLRGTGSPPGKPQRIAPRRELNYDEAPSRLYSLIERRDWNGVIARARQAPDEAGVFVYRLNNGKELEKSPRGDRSVLSFRSDTTTKVADNCVIRWRLLPLHAACIFRAPRTAIEALLRAYPPGVQMSDDGGKLPIHLACFSGSSGEVLECLLEAHPAGVETRDRKGRMPLDLVGKAQHVSKAAAREAREVMLHFGAESDAVDPDDTNTVTTATDASDALVKYGALSSCLSTEEDGTKKQKHDRKKIGNSKSRENGKMERKAKKKIISGKKESMSKTEGVEIAIEEEIQTSQSMPETLAPTVATTPTLTSRERLRSALAQGRTSQRKFTGMMKKALLRRFATENHLLNKKDSCKVTTATTEDEHSSTADDDEGSSVVEKVVLENGQTEERSIRMLSTY